MTIHRLYLGAALFLILGLIFFGRTELAIGLAKQPYDKLLHVGCFGFLALLIWYGNAYKARLTFVLVSALTIADEFYQLSIPGRHGSIKDVLAGMLGALIVLVFLTLMRKVGEKENLKPET